MSRKVVRFKMSAPGAAAPGSGASAAPPAPAAGEDQWVAGAVATPQPRRRSARAAPEGLAAAAEAPAAAAEELGGQAAAPRQEPGTEILPRYAVDISAAQVGAFTDLSVVLMGGLQDMSSELVRLGCGSIERSAERVQRLIHCRTPQDFMALQAQLARESLAAVLMAGGRAAALTARTAEEAANALGARNPTLEGFAGEGE